MILASHEDQQAAADYALCDLDDAIAVLRRMPGESLADFAERLADQADDLARIGLNARKETVA